MRIVLSVGIDSPIDPIDPIRYIDRIDKKLSPYKLGGGPPKIRGLLAALTTSRVQAPNFRGSTA